jgi:hypothetical protein
LSSTNGGYKLAIRYFGTPYIPKSSGWWSLYSDLEALDIQAVKPESYSTATHLLVIDYNRKDIKQWPKLPITHRFLTATEPVSVNPVQFSKKVTSQFHKVIVPSLLSPHASNTVVYEGGYFNPLRYSTFFSNDGNRQGCALINENKFSFASQSNYILRTKFIQQSLKHDLNLTIAGKNWTRGISWTIAKIVHHLLIGIRARQIRLNIADVLELLKFSLRKKRVKLISTGVVPDSIEFLSQFKISIVIENESSYVSEKLHAAYNAGCQCVYVGPKLNPRDFPTGFLFQAEPHPVAILEQTELAMQTQYAISTHHLRNHIVNSSFFTDNSASRRNAWVAKSLFGWMSSNDEYPLKHPYSNT